MAEAKLVAKIETQGAKKAASELDQFSDKAGKSEKGTGKLVSALKKAPKALLAVGAAAATATAAITKLAIDAADARFELSALASVAGESTNDFQALAFATDSVGISAEKLADISKDTKEKLGEFIATGGGGFKDFFEEVAPLVGITATELEHLSGPQVLQKVKDAMDATNISLSEQSFFLESIASDTTLLIPLLAQEGAALQVLTDRFNAATASMQLTANQDEALQDLAQTFDLLKEQSGVAAGAISATLAPTLDQFFNDVIAVVPTATQALVDFFNTFIDAKNLSSIDAVDKRIKGLSDQIVFLRGRVSERGEGFSLSDIIGLNDLDKSTIEQSERELKALLDQRKKLLDQSKKLADAAKLTGGGIGGAGSKTVDADAAKAEAVQRAAADAFLAEADKLGRSRLELIGIQETERLETLRGFANQGLIDFTDFEDAKTRILDDATQQRVALEREALATNLAASEQAFGAMADLAGQFAGKQSGVYKALFVTQKAFALASAINNMVVAQSQAASDPTAITLPQKLANVALITSQMVGIISTLKGNDFSARAQGGQFRSGQDLLVGEKGPELVRFGSGGRIADAGQTASMMGGSGGNVTIINQTSGRIDETEVRREDNGDMIIIAREVMNREVLNPNSEFNKNLDRTRQVQRQF